jgi:aspartate kinase
MEITRYEHLVETSTEKIPVVIKVGGSCLTGGDAVRKTVDKIHDLLRRGMHPILVVSALNGITNSLFDVATTGHKIPDPAMIDEILSEGEQLSAKIICSALKNAGIHARAFLLSERSFPIITDAVHGNANILLEETERKIHSVITPLIEKSVIPVIPGFVGKTREGTVTTLGRGGSDITAVLLGKLLGVKEIILLKDVPGVLSGDPKMLDAPTNVTSLTASELMQLGMRGGQIICPDALLYKSKDTTIRIVEFASHDLLDGGTEIVGELEDERKIEIAREKKTAITLIGKDFTDISLYSGIVSDIFAKKGVPCSSIFISDHSLCFYIPAECERKALNLLHPLVTENKGLSAVASLSEIILVKIKGRRKFLIETIMELSQKINGRGMHIIDLSLCPSEARIFIHNLDVEEIAQAVGGTL